MGWFDEQIRQRKKSSEQAFEESFIKIAEAVTGSRINFALGNDRHLVESSINEILQFYRIHPHQMPEDIDDINEILEFQLRPHGIMHRNVNLTKGWYKDCIGAMLGSRKDDGSIVALIPRWFSGYRFFDKKLGKYVNITSRNESDIDTEAIAFYKPFPLKKMTIVNFMGYMKDQVANSDILMVNAASLAVTAMGLLMTELTSKLFSTVLNSGSLHMLLGMAIFMLCTTFSMNILNIINSFAVEKISLSLNLNVEAATMMRVLSLPPRFFKDYNAGELASRMSLTSDLSTMLVRMLMSTGITGIFSLAYVIQIFHFAPALAAPALLIALISLALSVITVFMQAHISKLIMESNAKESGICHSLITGIQKIRLSGSEERAFAKWANIYAESAALTYNPPMLLKLSPVISTGISLIGTIVIYYLAIMSKVSISEYFAFNTAYGILTGAFFAFAEIAVSVANIEPTLEMVKPILEAVPEIDENKKIVTRLNGGIEISNVTFSYDENMPPVLEDFSLKINPGQYVAIVGKTGCGKSTLMKLLLGFETPQKGAVYYDGHDIKTLDTKSLRRRIGTVMQDGKLITDDIFSNIVICAPHLTLQDAWEAAQTACIADDIAKMPMGMNTMISEGQGGISGGQRQRIMIARAIAPKPKILMFDEATSALDNITQKHISNALDSLKCTRLVIAHRLSTIKNCDRIVVIDSGKIVEDGSYDELIRKDGFFAELVRRQQVNES